MTAANYDDPQVLSGLSAMKLEAVSGADEAVVVRLVVWRQERDGTDQHFQRLQAPKECLL